MSGKLQRVAWRNMQRAAIWGLDGKKRDDRKDSGSAGKKFARPAVEMPSQCEDKNL